MKVQVQQIPQLSVTTCFYKGMSSKPEFKLVWKSPSVACISVVMFATPKARSSQNDVSTVHLSPAEDQKSPSILFLDHNKNKTTLFLTSQSPQEHNNNMSCWSSLMVNVFFFYWRLTGWGNIHSSLFFKHYMWFIIVFII